MTIQTAIKVRIDAVMPCGSALESAGQAAAAFDRVRKLLTDCGFSRIEIGSKLTNINVQPDEAGSADPGEA